MSTLMLLKHGLASVGETLWRRARGRPRVERWPFGFEVLWGWTRRNLFASRDLSPQELRARQESMAREPEDLPVDRDKAVLGGVDVEWFRPDEPHLAVEDELVVYLHGGGYVFGSTDTHAVLMSRLALETERPVLGVDYALAPEHDVADARDDVVGVWHALVEEGWRPEHMTLAGDSAGGGLSLSTCMALRDRDMELPAALALLSPWVDLQCDAPSYDEHTDIDLGTADMFRKMAEVASGDCAFDDPVVSPIYADLCGLPPTLIHVGGLELILDDCRRLAERLDEQGVAAELKVWDDMIHGFHMFERFLPEAEEAVAEAGAFLADHLPAGRP